MPGVTREWIDRLIEDLSKPEAFAEPTHTVTRAAVSADAVSVADQPARATTADGTAVPLAGRGFH
jgi:hypothetical protein